MLLLFCVLCLVNCLIVAFGGSGTVILGKRDLVALVLFFWLLTLVMLNKLRCHAHF